jgi:hypothetical protein
VETRKGWGKRNPNEPEVKHTSEVMFNRLSKRVDARNSKTMLRISAYKIGDKFVGYICTDKFCSVGIDQRGIDAGHCSAVASSVAAFLYPTFWCIVGEGLCGFWAKLPRIGP